MRRAGLTAGVLTMALTACGGTHWGFPYRPDVQQGNWITAEQVAQLQQGMTREQVRFILGTPTLQDIFRTNRWDYPYYNKPGYGEEEKRQFTVWFERSEEHTSELQSLMRISYAVFCLKKKKQQHTKKKT